MNDIRDIVKDGVTADRAADSMRVTDCNNGGLTTWKKRRVIEVSAPLCTGAAARTIRVHELLHANHSPAPRKSKFPAIAENAIEDARVHSIYWPDRMPRRANRDCLTTAIADMRTIPPMAALGRADDWNKCLLIALRTMSIFARLGTNGKNDSRLGACMLSAFGPRVAEQLQDILPMVRSRKNKALAAFTALMRDKDGQPVDGEGSAPGKGSTGAETANPMRIVRLPMPDACNTTIRRTALARSGSRINRARLVRAVTTGSTVGLFIRPRYLSGGTYLFDASGSMGITERRLNELCRSVPAATVAYYSGWGFDQPDGTFGELAIYAENGRRAAEVDNRHNGNEVDLYAIRWLLTQPAPRVYVGDGGFCGGPEGQDVKAATLLAMAVATGKVTWFKSVPDLP